MKSLARGFGRRRRRTSQPHRDRRNARRRVLVELLEKRNLLTTFFVTDLNDGSLVDLAGDGQLSLREALEAANTDSSVDGSDPGSGADVIQFNSGLSGSIDLAGGQLEILDDLEWVGPGEQDLAINAQGNSRVLSISGAGLTVSLSGLTITGGNIVDGPGGGIDHRSDGSLTISNSTITGNTASGTDGHGGGLAIDGGVVQLIDSTVDRNVTREANNAGGGIYLGGISGSLTLVGSTVSGNETTGNSSNGGGIYSSSQPVHVIDSTISANEVRGSSSRGGGIAGGSATINLLGSTISGNRARGASGHGGGVYSVDGPLSITNTTISNNRTYDSLGNGGGLFFRSATTRIVNSTITANTAANAGGGIAAFVNNSGENLTLHNSIVARNRTGGGIAPDMLPPAPANLTVLASLIGDNTGTSLPESQTPDPSTGNIVGDPTGVGIVNPQLEFLRDNGGPTQTHALRSGSPAIDTGETLFALAPGPDGISGTSDDVPLVGDQRGPAAPRSVGVNTDMGAYERVIESGPVVVTTTADELNFANVVVSLREAIETANVRVGDGVVHFDPGVFSFPRSILLSHGGLRVTDPITINGSGSDQLSINGGGRSRVFDSVSSLVLNDLTIEGGRANGHGGGVSASGSVTLTRTNILGNTATGDGGGVFTDADLVIEDSLISGNSAGDAGGGLYGYGSSVSINRSTISGNEAAGVGGGVQASYNATVTGSTISGNTAGSDGGGIYSSDYEGDVTLINSTLSGNHSGGRGGGLFFDDGETRIINTTIALNRAADAGGGVGNSLDGNETLVVYNSIIADNSDDGSSPDFVAPTDPGSNLEVFSSLIGNNAGTSLAESQTPDAVTGNIVGDPVGAGIVDPMIVSLSENGGGTQTHALMVGSPALDNADPAFALGLGPDGVSGTGDDVPLVHDQRGAPLVRNQGSSTDMGAFEAQGLMLTVTNTNDAGPGSLRDAIEQSNSVPNAAGIDAIGFDIPGPTPHTIQLTTALPFISDAVTIDGTTEPDHAGTPVVQIDGGAGLANGLVTLAGGSGSTINGLSITGFRDAGIQFFRGGNNSASSNWIGVDLSGQADGNRFGVKVVNSHDNTVSDNLVSGNFDNGVFINGAVASGNVVEGNLIGTDSSGTERLPNHKHGVALFSPHNSVLDNTISGNNGSGVFTRFAFGGNNTIEGNRIGVDAIAADSPVANGIGITLQSADNIVSSNTIGGNSREGLIVSGLNATNNLIDGNKIGLSGSGDEAVGNGGDGVRIVRGASSNTVSANTISGNGSRGVAIDGAITNDNVVSSNSIGTTEDRSSTLHNASDVAILITAAENTIDNNTISAIDAAIVAYTTKALGNVIESNDIGSDPTLATPDGIHLLNGAANTLILQNTIANGERGIILTRAAEGNDISENTIFAQSEIAIDLGGDGPTANDSGDPDEGENRLQNTPQITESSIIGNNLRVTYFVSTLRSIATYPMRVEFFVGGGAQAESFLGVDSYTGPNRAAGAKTITFVNALNSLMPGDQLTATATDADGNTSELSLGFAITGITV